MAEQDNLIARCNRGCFTKVWKPNVFSTGKRAHRVFSAFANVEELHIPLRKERSGVFGGDALSMRLLRGVTGLFQLSIFDFCAVKLSRARESCLKALLFLL